MTDGRFTGPGQPAAGRTRAQDGLLTTVVATAALSVLRAARSGHHPRTAPALHPEDEAIRASTGRSRGRQPRTNT